MRATILSLYGACPLFIFRAPGIPFILDDGTGETPIGDNKPFLWVNRFTPDPAAFPFRLDEVQIAWSSTYLAVGDSFSLYIYQDIDEDPSNGFELLASYTPTIGVVNAFDTYPLVDGPIFTGPGDVS